MGSFAWPDEAVERLRRIIDDGTSSGAAARIMSAEFGHPLSRSAVMSKAISLGLHFKSTDATNRKPKSAAAKTTAKAAPALARVTPVLEPIMETVETIDVAIPTSRRVELIDLTNSTCRWPLWRGDEPRLFCGAHGADFASRRPYCAAHAKASISRVFTKDEREKHKREKVLKDAAKKRAARAA